MVSKDFDRTIKFRQILSNGHIINLPIVEVSFFPNGIKTNVPLLFDTGASITTLSADLFPILGLQSWNQGVPSNAATASGIATIYQYQTTIEIFGKSIHCPVCLAQLPHNPLYQGLLGRNTIFDEFGFGFWENARELYVTANP
jgi:hypothetical protein